MRKLACRWLFFNNDSLIFRGKVNVYDNALARAVLDTMDWDDDRDDVPSWWEDMTAQQA